MWNNDAGYLTEINITSPWQESYKHVYRASGRVGIGTDSPQKALHIFNSNKKGLPPEYPVLRLELHGSSNISPNHTVWDIKSSGTRLDFMYAEVKADGSTKPSTKFRVSSSGTLTATKFVGDGSGLTNLNIPEPNWLNNGNNTYYTKGKVGIGTDAPLVPIHIFSNDPDIFLEFEENSTNTLAEIRFSERGGGTSSRIYWNKDNKNIVFDTEGDFCMGTENPHILSTGGYARLSVNGGVAVRQIEVTQLSWADNVFTETYKLMPLYEVEKYVIVNKHLPDIPSEKEILEQGLNLGEMQKLQMQKIEELTLYIIDLQKQIDDLKSTRHEK